MSMLDRWALASRSNGQAALLRCWSWQDQKVDEYWRRDQKVKQFHRDVDYAKTEKLRNFDIETKRLSNGMMALSLNGRVAIRLANDLARSRSFSKLNNVCRRTWKLWVRNYKLVQHLYWRWSLVDHTDDTNICVVKCVPNSPVEGGFVEACVCNWNLRCEDSGYV